MEVWYAHHVVILVTNVEWTAVPGFSNNRGSRPRVREQTGRINRKSGWHVVHVIVSITEIHFSCLTQSANGDLRGNKPVRTYPAVMRQR
jgi:hypothetical protein